jgi:hypothetical protein
MRSPLALVLVLSLPVACAPDALEPPAPLWRAEVTAGDHDRLDAIVRAPLPGDETAVRLVEVTAGRFIPTSSQVHDGVLYWVLDGETPRGGTRSFHLLPASPSADGGPTSAFAVNDEKGKCIEVELEGRPVLRYNYGVVAPPDGEVCASLARNAYLHPVWTPSGRIVTDDFPPSHPHQRGIWMAWTSTEFEGRTPDFWNLGDGSGTVRFERLEGVTQGPIFAGLRVVHLHVDRSSPEKETVALEEEWDVRVFRVGGRRWGFHLFELVSIQRRIGEGALVLPEYQYGGMAFRGSRGWTPDGVRVLTSGELDRRSGDGSRSEWCLMEGPLDRGVGGLAAFGHPLNFRSPQPLRIHPEAPYFAFAPMRLGPMEIDPGEPYVSRYRFLAFDGSAPREVIDAYWLDYSAPPAVSWSSP